MQAESYVIGVVNLSFLIDNFEVFYYAFWILILAWNIIVFLIFGSDKSRAKKGKWRIEEQALLGCAFFGGALGALLGMLFFHHKTKKLLFIILVPIFLLLNIGMLYLMYIS